jgi:hypothetical protein
LPKCRPYLCPVTRKESCRNKKNDEDYRPRPTGGSADDRGCCRGNHPAGGEYPAVAGNERDNAAKHCTGKRARYEKRNNPAASFITAQIE